MLAHMICHLLKFDLQVIFNQFTSLSMIIDILSLSNVLIGISTMRKKPLRMDLKSALESGNGMSKMRYRYGNHTSEDRAAHYLSYSKSHSALNMVLLTSQSYHPFKHCMSR